MTHENLILRAYRPGDEIGINESFNRVFGLDRSLEEWAWKFRDQGLGRCISVATDGDERVVAHYGAIPVRIRLGDLEIWGGQIVDAFSVPEVRGTRVFSELYLDFVERFCRPDGLALGFGFPGRRHYEMGLKRLGYVPLGAAPYLRRKVSREAFRLPIRRWTVRPMAGGDELAAVWSACAARYPFATIRDRAYLEWRFGERPGVRYHQLFAAKAGRVQALAVARVLEDRVRVADLIWNGEDPGAVRALSRALTSLARGEGCRVMEAWLGSDRAARECLEREGWSSEAGPEDLVWVARSFHPGVDLGKAAERQYLTFGDSDLV